LTVVDRSRRRWLVVIIVVAATTIFVVVRSDRPAGSCLDDPGARISPASPVHDPAVVRHDGTTFVFATGEGIPMWMSRDLESWQRIGEAFDNPLPEWAASEIPESTYPWAPDVVQFNDTWHLYYSVSTWASKQSAIGVATSPTLDPCDADYGWTDRGVVVRSTGDSFSNAIDPNVFVDAEGVPWLTWGSFWGGIQLARLDPATGGLASLTETHNIASRQTSDDFLNPIEAPYLVRRGDYHYLFVSFDFCCRGIGSDYSIRVGRSETVTGPYVDANGVPLLAGGGTPVLQGAGDRIGPGHNAILQDSDDWHLVFHYYDASNDGAETLGVLPIKWVDGWPTADWADIDG
jgi:arabinan endo-1,5-alpha-L-arabinosidase